MHWTGEKQPLWLGGSFAVSPIFSGVSVVCDYYILEECCEMVREFFVRVLRSTGVIQT